MVHTNLHNIFQLSTPRSGSNIIARVLGDCADEKARSLAMDAPTGVKLSEHIDNITSSMTPPFKNDPPVAYFKEHAACLTKEHLAEIDKNTSAILVTQRDPSLMLESMLRKLTLTDKNTGKESRINAKMTELLASEEMRKDIAERLQITADDRNAIIMAETAEEASKLLLDSFPQQHSFESWSDMQHSIETSRDYRLTNALLQVTHPDRLQTVDEYAKPQQFFTHNPFHFIRTCTQRVQEYVEQFGDDKLTIIDATSFRASDEIKASAAESLGLNPNNIPKSLNPSVGKAMDARTSTAPIYIGRAMSSDQVDQPFEKPLSPDMMPDFLVQEGGLYWEMLEQYAQSVASDKYIAPKNPGELKKMLKQTVTQEEGRDVLLMERNPLFSYANVVAIDMLPHEKNRLLTEIRKASPDFETSFNTIDALNLPQTIAPICAVDRLAQHNGRSDTQLGM